MASGRTRVIVANKKKIFTVLLIVLTVFTIFFIFSNSMESIPESKEKSEGVLELLKPILEPVFGEENLTDHLVRKMAHLVEFFLLGTELCGLCLLFNRPMAFSMLGGLIIALSDETIQLVYERGSQVQDVWLDFSAVITAALLTLLLKKILTRRGKHKV